VGTPLADSAEATGKFGVLVGPGVELLASVDLVEGGQVNFMRTEDGLLGVSQVYRMTDAEPIRIADVKRLGAAEVFRRLAPERVVPDALLELDRELKVDPDFKLEKASQTRVDEPSLDRSTADEFVAQRAPVAGQLQQAVVDDSKCPGEKFEDEECGSVGVCKINRTNDGKIVKDDMVFVQSKTCSYRGNIEHRLDYDHWGDWKILDTILVKPGWVKVSAFITFAGEDFWDGDFDFEAIIQKASGDGWNHYAWSF
jgi:hypothetical protein